MPVLAGVRPDSLELATPCTEWNVLALINHNLAVQRFVDEMLSKAAPAMPGEADLTAPLHPDGADAALRSIAGSIVSKLNAMGLEEMVESPFGPMAAGEFLMFPMSDLFIHKWDLAKATNQDASLDSQLAEVCFEIIAPVAPAGRENGAFAPEVEVAANATIQERLLALSGRRA